MKTHGLKTYVIEGMTCDNCVRHVTDAVAAVPGVVSVQVDLGTSRAEVTGDIQDFAIIAAVDEAGYSVVV